MKLHTWLRVTALPVLSLALLTSACSDEPGDPILGPLASASAGGEQVEVSDPLAGTETVLVVDDEKVVRRLVSSALVRYGYTVLEAEDGADALELAASHAGALDLLLTEVSTSTLSGPELEVELRKEHADLKVLFLADSADVSSVPSSVLIRKPFEREELLSRVREVLGALTDPQS